MRCASIALLLSLVAGCGAPGDPDAGGGDSGAVGPRDAGARDAGAPDGGAPDAGAADAGSDGGVAADGGDVGSDASVPDAGALDCATARDVAVGSDHTCAIREDGALFCWGENDDGELGLGDALGRDVPTRVGTSAGWTDVSAGADYVCGIDGGSLFCFGRNLNGRLGLGDLADRDVPTRVGAETTWTAVDTGGFHACGTRGTTIACWGHNFDGRIGDGSTADRLAPTDLAGAWARVTAGGSSTCGLDVTQTPFCWGGNSDGQLGVGTSGSGANETMPRVVRSEAWRSLSMATFHACGVRSDGQLFCWGSNGLSQLGLGMGAGPSTTPARVGTAASWREAVTGPFSSCALDDAGALYCWGGNGSGQLGLGDEDTRHTPERVGSRAWQQVELGSLHGCGRDLAGALYCWGDNRDGRLGLGGSVTAALAPTRVCLPPG